MAELRGKGGNAALVAFAPRHGGATASGRPTLYFRLAQPTTSAIVATLTLGQEPVPVKTWTLPEGAAAGVHGLALGEDDPDLAEGDYVWVVEVRQFPGAASKNPSVRSKLRRVSPDEAARFGALSPAERVVGLANAGVFYDAVHQLLTDPSATPNAQQAARYPEEFQQVLELAEVGRDAAAR